MLQQGRSLVGKVETLISSSPVLMEYICSDVTEKLSITFCCAGGVLETGLLVQP